jgi:hypothetical protein
MRQQLDGDLEVIMGETIKVSIDSNLTALLAHSSAIDRGRWSSVVIQGSNETREFTVDLTFSNPFHFVVGFDFSPGPGGVIDPNASYTITVSGDGPGGFVRKRTILPRGILPTTRVFNFEVV